MLVTGGVVGTYPLTALSTNLGCVDFAEVTLAKLNVEGATIAPATIPSSLTLQDDLGNLTIDRQRTLVFSSNDEESRYMINGKVFYPELVDQQVRLGDVEEWTLRNMDDDEQSHSFHIHINDFQAMSINGQPYNAHGLQDTVVLPGHGEVVIRIPF